MVLARNLTFLNTLQSNTMHGLYTVLSTESIKMQHNQLLEIDGFGVVRVKYKIKKILYVKQVDICWLCITIMLKFINNTKQYFYYSNCFLILTPLFYELISGQNQQTIKNLSLTPGTHGFPFAIQLPRDRPLPAPFEGRYGYVRYKAKATVSLIRTLSNKEFKTERYFSMIGPTVDLNLIPNMEVWPVI